MKSVLFSKNEDEGYGDVCPLFRQRRILTTIIYSNSRHGLVIQRQTVASENVTLRPVIIRVRPSLLFIGFCLGLDESRRTKGRKEGTF